MSKPDLQSCWLQGEKGSVLIAESCSVHIQGSFTQEPQWALTWWRCWKQEGTSHSSLHPLLPELSWKGIFAVWFWALGSRRTLREPLGTGSPWTTFLLCQIYSAVSSLNRQNNWFSLWKVQCLIKYSCTFQRFISIFIWIFTFHDVLKYFQGKVCSDNKMPG